MKNIIFLLALFMGALLNAQEASNADFINIDKNRDFNLPIQGISIKMPSPMKIGLPQFEEGHEFLQIDRNVNFILQPGFLDSRQAFEFSTSCNTQSRMTLYVRVLNNFLSNVFLNTLKDKHPTLVEIEPLKNDLGISLSYRDILNEKSIDHHVFYIDRVLYHFEMETDIADKSVYESMLKRVKRKNFKKELARYEKMMY